MEEKNSFGVVEAHDVTPWDPAPSKLSPHQGENRRSGAMVYAKEAPHREVPKNTMLGIGKLLLPCEKIDGWVNGCRRTPLWAVVLAHM